MREANNFILVQMRNCPSCGGCPACVSKLSDEALHMRMGMRAADVEKQLIVKKLKMD
jgi:flavoprotein